MSSLCAGLHSLHHSTCATHRSPEVHCMHNSCMICTRADNHSPCTRIRSSALFYRPALASLFQDHSSESSPCEVLVWSALSTVMTSSRTPARKMKRLTTLFGVFAVGSGV